MAHSTRVGTDFSHTEHVAATKVAISSLVASSLSSSSIFPDTCTQMYWQMLIISWVCCWNSSFSAMMSKMLAKAVLKRSRSWDKQLFDKPILDDRSQHVGEHTGPLIQGHSGESEPLFYAFDGGLLGDRRGISARSEDEGKHLDDVLNTLVYRGFSASCSPLKTRATCPSACFSVVVASGHVRTRRPCPRALCKTMIRCLEEAIVVNLNKMSGVPARIGVRS